MAPVLMPILKAFYRAFRRQYSKPFGGRGRVSLKGVAQVLTGDFSGAWESAKKIAQAVMNGIIRGLQQHHRADFQACQQD